MRIHNELSQTESLPSTKLACAHRVETTLPAATHWDDGPLGDPARTLRNLLPTLMFIGGTISAAALLIYQVSTFEESGNPEQSSPLDEILISILALLLVFVPFGLVLLFYRWLLPSQPTNALYLRSFRTDRHTLRIRNAISYVLGDAFRLSGIRDPRRRFSRLDYLGLGFFAIRYASPKYMNLEACGNWKLRVWNTLPSLRCVIIDLRDLTHGVKDEVRLVTGAIGLDRVLFIGDDSKPESEWRAMVKETIQGFPVDGLIHLATWNPARWTISPDFLAAIKNFLDQLPSGNSAVHPESRRLALHEHLEIQEPYVHDSRFVAWCIWYAIVLGLISLIAGEGLGTMLAVIGLPIFAWMLIMYFLECGSIRRRITMITVAALILVPSVIVFPALSAAREATRSMLCRNHLMQLGLAIQNAHDVHQGLVPTEVYADTASRDTRSPLYSGRVLLLPHLDQTAVYYRFDLKSAWNLPANSEVAKAEIPIFHCPSNVGKRTTRTDYFFVRGENAALQPTALGRHEYGWDSSLWHVTDDRSHTLLMIERSDADVHWAEPLDPVLQESPPTVPRAHPTGANALMADGSARNLSRKIDPRVLRALTTRDGGEPVTGF